MLCSERNLRARVIAHSIDTDFQCCCGAASTSV